MKYLLFVICFLAFQTSFSQNWTGAINSNWNNAANWSTTPTNGASIVINPANYTGNAISPIIASNSTFTIDDMEISNGAILTIGANLTTLDDVDVLDPNSEIIVNQGIFSVNFGNNGRLIADLGGKITVNGGTVNVGQRLISGFDAQITINNGTVTTNERLLMDLGGKVILHNGNVTVGQVMALADGDINGSSYFEQNGGTITVTGEVALENEAGNYQPTIRINHGTFTLNGDLVWFGSTPGSGTPRVITTGGIFNINGAISNLPLSTVNMLFDIKDSSQVNFTGTSIDQINITDSIKQSGNSIFKLSGTHNWNNAGVFYANDGLVLCNGTSNLLGSGKYTFHDLTINTVKTLNQVLPNELFINGDFTNLGTFNPAGHKVTFNGISPQTINGTTPINFSSLKIDNTFGVSLNHPISLADSLILSAGHLNTSSTNLLTMNSTSSSNGGSTLSFIVGPMKKIGNTPFVFPIGKNTNWRRMGISAPSSVSSELTAEYFNSSAINTNTYNSPLSAVSNIEHWQLVKSNPADNLTIELYWENASQSGITDCAATSIAYYNGTSWDNVNSIASGICTGTGNGSVISNSTLSNLGLFTIGYFGNVVSQTITVCNGDSFVVGTNTYTASGNYIDVLTDINNDDSTIITNLTVLPVLASSQTIQICFGDSLTVGNSTYNLSGTYSDILSSINNCDSTVTTYLTVLALPTSSQTIQICSAETFTIGNSTYNLSGSYTDTLTTSNGCDSIVTTNLTVANSIDVSTAISGITLSANNTTATAYQWLDCVNGYSPISGANSSTFLPLVNGNYAVEITEGSCTDTSVCLIVNSVGLSEEIAFSKIAFSKIAFYPNPSSGSYKVKLPNTINSVKIELSDITGKLLIKDLIIQYDGQELNLSSYPDGVYMVKLYFEGASKTVRLIKQ